MKKLTMDNRRGISMLETVIALAIILVVSAAALSIVISGASVEAKYLRSMSVLSCCESSVECFRYAENEEDFLQALRHLDAGFAQIEETVFRLEKDSYRIELIADFENHYLEFYAVTPDGEEIYRLNYEKQDLLTQNE